MSIKNLITVVTSVAILMACVFVMADTANAATTVTLNKSKFVYNGNSQGPVVLVYDNGKRINAKEYKVTGTTKASKTGDYNLTVTYKKTKIKKAWGIYVEDTKISNVKYKNGSLSAVYGIPYCDEYECTIFEPSKTGGYVGKKSYEIKNSKKTSKTVTLKTKLTPGVAYYVEGMATAWNGRQGTISFYSVYFTVDKKGNLKVSKTEMGSKFGNKTKNNGYVS